MEAFFQNSSVVREAALSTAFENSLAPETLHAQAPAVFAPSAHMRTSAAYTFISTERLLAAFQSAGFLPVSVRQARTRTADELLRAPRGATAEAVRDGARQGRRSGDRVLQLA